MDISVKIDPDAGGYTGRECPTCEKYFKIKFGTGLPGEPPCHCPYCNHTGPQNEFWTKPQIAYAQSVAVRKLSGQLLGQLKKLERKPDRNAMFSIGIKVEGNPTPIAYYREEELEERVTCSACTLEYTIYGVFGFCPDCGIHNSLQIANANFDLVLRTLDLAQAAPEELRGKLIENALEDAVSSFDGFGREHCKSQPWKISFQSIDGAREKISREIGIDISSRLDSGAWKLVAKQFQKRHLLAHKLGVIDSEYLLKTGEPQSQLGRKVAITDSDVRELVVHLRAVAASLYHGVPREAA
jgi:hypothetical protein